MSKDKSLLLGVSDLFTEDTLEEILRKVSGEKDVKVLSWDFGEASNKGDGYLSIVHRVKVKGQASGNPIETSLVVKSMPKNLGRRKTFRSTDFFWNEITCYVEIFPKFQEFLKSKGHPELYIVPRCLAAVTDGENDFLALEDVSCLGFGPVTRQSTLTLPQCNVILRALARFHATSFAFKDQNPEEFERLAGLLLETYFTPKLFEWYKDFQAILVRVAKDALSKEYPGSKATDRFNALTGKDLYDKSVGFCSRVNAPTSVITQGDSWAPNFLIRKAEGDNQTALALDFQLARCASPVLDMTFFIYSCTEKSLRDEHYDELLKTYYDEIAKSIALLGSDPQKLYPWDVFMQEVQEQSVHGITFCIEAIPFAILESSEAYDLDIIKGDEAINVADIWDVKNIKSQEGRRRLAETIVHAVERNYL